MEIFSQLSTLAPKQNLFGTESTRLSDAKALKNQDTNNASNNSAAKEINDTVSLSQDAKNTAIKKSSSPNGSFKINNYRINYSLTENNDLVIKIIDKKSNELIRQIPPREMMKIKEALSKVLEQQFKE